MELTGTFSSDVIMPLLLLLSVWEEVGTCDYRATLAQGNHRRRKEGATLVCLFLRFFPGRDVGSG